MAEQNRMLSTKMSRALGLVDPPIATYYTDERPKDALGRTGDDVEGRFCNLGYLRAVRTGRPAFVDRENPGCHGAAYFMGFTKERAADFAQSFSCTPDGRGERFKKTPELARSYMDSTEPIPAPARFCVFDLLADLPEGVTPESVVFLVEPDTLSGLVSLANYGRPGQGAVIMPFTSGCGSLIYEPRRQATQAEPKAVLGMLDVTVRNLIEKHTLSLAVPYSMFLEMADNIDGSFLEIEPWTRLRGR